MTTVNSASGRLCRNHAFDSFRSNLSTCHTHGIINIQTADQAATALQPIVSTFPYAGVMAKTIFALGLIGTGLLAIPVMAGASAYALSDALGWKEGLSKKSKTTS